MRIDANSWCAGICDTRERVCSVHTSSKSFLFSDSLWGYQIRSPPSPTIAVSEVPKTSQDRTSVIYSNFVVRASFGSTGLLILPFAFRLSTLFLASSRQKAAVRVPQMPCTTRITSAAQRPTRPTVCDVDEKHVEPHVHLSAAAAAAVICCVPGCMNDLW